jgi:carbohydrate binding domain protein
MKKILNALFLTLLAVFTFSSCSDVPAPYDILGEGDVPGLTGDGTKENPYSIEAAQQKQDGTIAWVQGYIVGTVENYEDPSGSAKFAAPFTAKNNLLIAASATETNVKNCVCVQLSSGTELYSKLNLAENATNLGHILAIQGSLEKFYGFPGVKSTTAATLDGKDVGGSGETDPDNPLGLDDSNPVNSFSATFDDAVNNNDYLLTNWYNVAVTGGRRWQGKIFNNTDKYIQATSYNASGSNFECWFVTPAFKVDEIADKTVSFKCAVYNYATAAANSNLEVYFLKLVNGKMESSKLTIDGMPTTDNTWVPLEAKLDSYAGQTGFVGFKYTSTSSTEALSYRLDDIQAGKGQGGGETPGEGTELLTNGGFENWADGYPTGWKSASTASSATLEQSTDKRSGTYSVLVQGASSNKRLGSTEMTLKAGTYVFSAYFKAATAEKAGARLGYVPIGDDGTPGNYAYDADYVNDITDTEWVTKSYMFTLTEEQTICLVVMNPKSPGKDLLIDDASLKTEDGGIVGGGGVDPEPSTGELFISEYVEGSSYNKYMEIYNPTSQSIDLSSYVLKLEQDGKGTWTKEATLSGSLASKSVIIYKNSQATAYTGEAIVNNDVINFNGNDPVGLFKNGELIDLFGASSETPGQAVADFAKDKTFRRKATVKAPSTVFNAEEWEVLAKDDVSGLGSHTME